MSKKRELTMANVEAAIDELMEHASCGVLANRPEKDQLALLMLGMRLRHEVNPEGSEMIYTAAAYGLLRRYRDLQAQAKQERSGVA